MNTIKAVLDSLSKKDSHDHYPAITVFTRGGKEFSGSLANWDQAKSPNLVKITSNSRVVCYINLADIEAVST
ncbi:hypothetical protein [Massilia soli]|uniref:Uncharacterized protein n=1 Tax=Massilia soli TaxID=2792854 RepID=A0ABS7SMN6_9BURK|nr:hypothetical protein [Massilia soli]MBZ2207136.1 hypothetical protein [Massilia soli]